MAQIQDATQNQKRLVLCFDGTDNKFSGDETDTNIVKIYELLNRECPDQYHYYQPGIGTYIPGKLENKAAGGIQKYRDAMFGTYFVNHVIGGYQFLLRYYRPGDKIYIFGFSRGAYTARFLSEMITSIGLLSMGNEEMITFAWETFSDFQRTAGGADETAYMDHFKSSFCRVGVKVHFLGLFDCVNSVLAFSSKLPMPHHVAGKKLPAKYVRHAVSIHERRGTFQPVLFDPEPKPPKKPDEREDPTEENFDTEGRKHLVELWFAGNHGDVGGGWPSYQHDGVKYLLSDIPLTWMIQQVKDIDQGAGANALQWNENLSSRSFRSGSWEAVRTHAQSQIDSWSLDNDKSEEENKQRAIAIRAGLHDVLQFKTQPPSNWRSKMMWGTIWWITEALGLPRWAQKTGTENPPLKHWRTTYKRNWGQPRPVPEFSKKHWSVARIRACQTTGAAALQWMDRNDENPNFIEVDIKKEIHESFLNKNPHTNGA
ncbi:hypothetical protein N431DRAFT_390190 [Stipitochalara longipes BDJ]|nr:hypothetical protein N431DRAFT_390190 [Stipitochalara longipes BDJ]